MCRILPARLCSSYARSAVGSTLLKSAASPDPSHSVPSPSALTVPTMWDRPSAGMQSSVLEGAGHGGVATLPRIVVSAEAVLLSATVTRVRRDVRGSPAGEGAGSYT